MDADQRFAVFIDGWAAERNSVFITDSFDGRESPELIDGMAVDDVRGWLIPNGSAKDDRFFGCLCWRNENGHLELTWRQDV